MNVLILYMENKFIESKINNEWEVFTDDGWVDIKAIHKTVKYKKWFLETKNHSLICADNHIVFVDDEMIEIFVKDLNIGDEILTDTGAERIINIVELNDMDNMYDLELDENSKKRYYTNGILSHNTSYLRYLTQNIKNKRLIYLPPDLAYRLAEPDFITFLMDIPGSILFIEDAENSLQKRELSGSSASQAVSNLLNSSDGLLGDALKLHIICTFNCSLDLIDTALQRPGRLIAEYKFEKLTSDKTKKLIEKLYGVESKYYIDYNNSEMTLAEVYNLDEKKHQSKKKYGQIGFNKK